jgi:hypothetical protein
MYVRDRDLQISKSHTGARVMSVIVALLLIASAVFLVVRVGSDETLSFETTADPHRVITALVGLLATKRRWQTVSQSEHGAHFVHVALTRRRQSLLLSVAGTGDITFVRVAASGRRGRAAARALRHHVEFATALGSCVNAVSRWSPSTLQGSATPELVAIISSPETRAAEVGIEAAALPPPWSALDDRPLVAQQLHS